MDILADLQMTVAAMQARSGVDVVEFRVGKNYAGFVCEAMAERGVALETPDDGDEVGLSFTDGPKGRLRVD